MQHWFRTGLFAALCVALVSACSRGYVALVVDPAIAPHIGPSLAQYKSDLEEDCYKVIEHSSGFADPAALRAYLIGLYAETGERLRGAILIGDLPRAYQLVALHSAEPEPEEVISFQYYADLDGVFGASPGYASPGGHSFSYDQHTGDVDWEIWIGVLPMYKGEQASTVTALDRYFEKNHAYRIGGYSIPEEFLEIYEHHSATTPAEHAFYLDELRNGPYSWTPLSSAPTARLYFDSPPGGLSVAQGYADMSAGIADFTVGEAHGSPAGHGDISIAWVEANGVRTVVFWSDGCAVGNLDQPDNFLAAVLYSPKSDVLVAKGTTNNSGGMGTNTNGFFGHNIATSVSEGDSLGEAVVDHVNVPLIWPWSNSREFHYATAVLLGDPTLRVRDD